ncbi:MAG TPA: S9 family peptidase [Vicinamibacterales bacterium]|jgi:dipeptidyl aminopeptidase/acylaminoacyl peptidase
MPKSVLCPSLLLLVIGITPAAAQGTTYTTCVNNEQLRHYQTVSDPQLSPDGTRVVWVQQESTADGAASHLWMASSDGSAPARQLTFSSGSDRSGESSPQWVPDGSAILFIARRGDARQIFRLPLAGGDAAPIKLQAGTDDLSPRSFEVSPNGQWLAFTASQPQTPQQKKDQKDKRDAVIVGQDENPSRVWVYSFAKRTVAALTPSTTEARAFAWNPDSSTLAVITGGVGDASDLGPDSTLEIRDVADPNQFRVVDGVPRTAGAVAFSPDGRQLAITAQSGYDDPPGVSDVYVLPTSGGTPANLTGPSDVTAAGRSLVWAKDGTGVYVQTQQHTRDALLKLPVKGSAPSWQAAATSAVSGFHTNREQTGWVFIAQATDRLPQVVYASTPGATGTVLSRANADWPANGWRGATTVSWKGPDDLTIEGLYFAPSTCAGGAPVLDGKSPMILMAHGGPTGAFTETFSPFVQWLTTQGWAVLEVNPRGSTGYGHAFTAADRNDLGGKDFEDEMAGLDWALAHRPVDSRRLGMYGYSYGGEMAGFIEGKTDRFAAIVSGAPVIDQYSEYGTEDGSWYDRWFFGQPWQRAADAWRQSPLSYARNAKTPLLLLQGESDTTDPMGQSLEEYRALRQQGVPVRLVTFPRENHGPLSGGISGEPRSEPWHGFQARSEILDWFQKYFRKAVGQ